MGLSEFQVGSSTYEIQSNSKFVMIGFDPSLPSTRTMKNKNEH